MIKKLRSAFTALTILLAAATVLVVPIGLAAARAATHDFSAKAARHDAGSKATKMKSGHKKQDKKREKKKVVCIKAPCPR